MALNMKMAFLLLLHVTFIFCSFVTFYVKTKLLIKFFLVLLVHIIEISVWKKYFRLFLNSSLLKSHFANWFNFVVARCIIPQILWIPTRSKLDAILVSFTRFQIVWLTLHPDIERYCLASACINIPDALLHDDNMNMRGGDAVKQ